MKISDFGFDLPERLIAKEPALPRDSCRLMVLDRKRGQIEDRNFFDLIDYLDDGDVLVFNDSKVIPARIEFNDNVRKMEILLIRQVAPGQWLAMGKPGKHLKKGSVFKISDHLECKIIEVQKDGERLIDFSLSGEDFDHELERIGHTPLPPYIKNSQASANDYQTIYANVKGSVAAPTAGLHFTDNLLNKLRSKGVQLEFVTLHVGPGTFMPVKTDHVEEHQIHSEFYILDNKTAKRLNDAKNMGKRIVAVGTTAVRVLESNFKNGEFTENCGETAIYIYPGYKWKCVDAMITNFHLPHSTLILLVSAFAGKDFILDAYNQAIKRDYRFYSFGDAMLII